MKTIKPIDSKNFLKCFLFFIYLLIVSIVSYHHEFFIDEANTWLKVMLPWNEILSHVVYTAKHEGHPPIWYIILFLTQKAGFTAYYYQSVINLLFSVLVAYYLIFRTKLPILIKSLILFSYPFIYEYSVKPRNYMIAILFLLIMANNFKIRKEKPFYFYVSLVLSIYSHSYAAIIAVCFFIMSIIEDVFSKKNFKFKDIKSILCNKYIVMVFISIALFAILMFPANDAYLSFSLGDKLNDNLALSIYNKISLSLFSLSNAFFTYKIIFLSFIVTSLFYYFCFMIIFRTNKRYFYYCFFIFVFLIIFLVFVYSFRTRHLAFLYLDIILFFIMIYNEKKIYIKNIEKILLAYFMFFSILSGMNYCYLDYKYNFGNGKLMANKINDLKINDMIYVDDWNSISVLPYLNSKQLFYFIDEDRVGRVPLWNQSTLLICNDITLKKCFSAVRKKNFQKLKRILLRRRNLIFLTTSKIKNKNVFNGRFKLRRIASANSESFDLETNSHVFYLYEISLKS